MFTSEVNSNLVKEPYYFINEKAGGSEITGGSENTSGYYATKSGKGSVDIKTTNLIDVSKYSKMYLLVSTFTSSGNNGTIELGYLDADGNFTTLRSFSCSATSVSGFGLYADISDIKAEIYPAIRITSQYNDQSVKIYVTEFFIQ